MANDTGAEDFGGGDDIRFERDGAAGLVTLTRPKALNAVNHRMVKALHAALDAWRNDARVGAVIVKAEGRAFSAGGDILDIYEQGKAGRPPVDFFADEYRLNAAIAAYPKPYVALVNGIVMGGGVGISFHGSHRAMTENAVFAMPEVGIGFFPDVGASFILPRLKGCFGLYLGLTGSRIRSGDAHWAGLATHTIAASDIPSIVERIAGGDTPDAALGDFHKASAQLTDESALAVIDRHFSAPSLPDLLRSLSDAATAGGAFESSLLETLALRSPTSLHLAFRQLRDGAALSMNGCMAMEFRILNRMLEGPDFYEGIRAAVVDKDNAPRWNPASLDDVDPAAVERYFARLGSRELVL